MTDYDKVIALLVRRYHLILEKRPNPNTEQEILKQELWGSISTLEYSIGDMDIEPAMALRLFNENLLEFAGQYCGQEYSFKMWRMKFLERVRYKTVQNVNYKELLWFFSNDIDKGTLLTYEGFYYEQVGEGNEWSVYDPTGKLQDIVTFGVLLARQKIEAQSDSAIKRTPFDDCMNRIFKKISTKQ